jgi:hypothetical protein
MGTPSVRRSLLALALGFLAAVVVLELAAAPALRPPHQADNQARVLAIPGVAKMVHGAQVDPTELTQVAARQHRPTPLALPAQALLDGLLLVTAAAAALPALLSRRNVTRGAGLGSFIASLAILLGGIAVAVAAIGRLRYLAALYLSPPFGTLSYLLLYGSFRRGAALLTLSVLLALKVGAGIIFVRAYPTALAKRGMAGLALTSVGATVVTAFCYALAPSSLAGVTDALAAAIAAIVAVLWAGVILSGSVRRLA